MYMYMYTYACVYGCICIYSQKGEPIKASIGHESGGVVGKNKGFFSKFFGSAKLDKKTLAAMGK